MTTKSIITEQISRILNGGTIASNSRFTFPEISQALNGVIAGLLKAQTLSTVFNFDGESIPDGAILATYENLPIYSRDAKRCRIKLPAAPITLPERNGVFSVYPSGYPELEYIPIPSGQIGFIIKDRLISTLSKKTYSWDSGYIYINSDVVGAGVDTIDVKMCVFDISAYGNNDILPLSPDLETQAIAAVIQLFSGEPLQQREDSKELLPEKHERK